MTHSMTGFARVEREHPDGCLTWEIRAVNHRFLDVQFRLPEDYRMLEPELRKQLSAKLKRGKVDCTLRYQPTARGTPELQLDTALLDQILEHTEAIRRKVRESGLINTLDLLRWPGLLREPERDTSSARELARTLFDEALEAMETARASEGQRLAEALLIRCDTIARTVAELRTRLPELQGAIRDKLTERVRQLGVEADPQRLEQELAFLAQKSDVDEELDRLDSHVTEVRQILKQTDPVGRRLDFLMQELNREANTLSSKSQDTGTTRSAVDIKVAIEQMREQVQNIE